MSAILPPKQPRRTPLKLSLPGSPNPDHVLPSSTGSTPSSLSLGAASLSLPSTTTSSKPSLKLGQLNTYFSNLSLQIPNNAGPSRYHDALKHGPESSSSSSSSSSDAENEGNGNDDDDDDDNKHQWKSSGQQEKMAGELLNVIRGQPLVGLEDDLSGKNFLTTGRMTSGARTGSRSSSRRPSIDRASDSQETNEVFDDRGDDETDRRHEESTVLPGEYDHTDVEITADKLQDLGKLGEGASGQVRKVRFKPTGMIMAKKTISTSPDPKVHKQHLRELLFMRECSHPGIVQYYGAYLELHNTQIDICMEYCEAGSLDSLYKQVKAHGWRTGEKVLGKIAESMISGLVYLHSRKIIHRDIKPSNVLVTIDGQVKLCDFGVSGELVNSMASTWIGTSFYLSPERIKGGKYSITSDIWSMAVTVLEVALNRYPFPGPGEAPISSPVELLMYLAKADVAQLDDEPDNGIKYTNGFRNFIQCCLDKDPTRRPGPQKLMEHGWIRRSIERQPPPDLARWVRDLL